MMRGRNILPSSTKLAGDIARRGIEYISKTERRSKPRDLARVFFGTQIPYGPLPIGALPVAFGLGWVTACTAIQAGTLLVGSLAVAAMALFGPLLGTNGTVFRGASLSPSGRYVGSFIAQTIDFGRKLRFELSQYRAGRRHLLSRA
jgi:purine-cytosine permease-like protein